MTNQSTAHKAQSAIYLKSTAMTAMPDPAKLVPAWSNEHCSAAQKEGWDIFDCGDSVHGPWQLQRIDDASDIEGGVQLKSDAEAWALVMNGSLPHHQAAKAFIKEHNPREWVSCCDEAKAASLKVVKVGVACRDTSGFATMFVKDVIVTPLEYDNDEHFEKAKDAACDQEYSGPFVCFEAEEIMALKSVIELFESEKPEVNAS